MVMSRILSTVFPSEAAECRFTFPVNELLGRGMEIRGMGSSPVPARQEALHRCLKITKGDSHSLCVWPGDTTGPYIFKGLLRRRRGRSDRDHMWPAKPKRFTIWPFTGEVCNLWDGEKGRALRLLGRGAWAVARNPAAVLPPGHQPPPLVALEGPTSVSPQPRPVSLEGPTSLALSMAPQSRSCQQTRVL